VLGFIALLLVVWLVLAVVGAVVEGLFWLLVIGAVLFVATAAFGWTKRNARV
jgi:TRAP-type C4-dicarboxylate transport system permease large subunit